MKKISLFVFALALTSLVGAQSAFAKSLKDIKIVYPSDINAACGASAGFDQVRGCYIQRIDPGVAPTYTIYLNKTLPQQVRDYVFLYSVGQFLIYDMNTVDLQTVFHPSPEKLALVGGNLHAYVSEQFVTWFYGEVSDRDTGLDSDDGARVDTFFRNALAGVK